MAASPRYGGGCTFFQQKKNWPPTYPHLGSRPTNTAIALTSTPFAATKKLVSEIKSAPNCLCADKGTFSTIITLTSIPVFVICQK